MKDAILNILVGGLIIILATISAVFIYKFPLAILIIAVPLAWLIGYAIREN